MTAFLTHFTIEMRASLRNKQLLFLYDLFPLAFYLLMGVVMVGINPIFRETLIPSMAVFTILASTMLGLPDTMVSPLEAGVFRGYKVNGIPALNILLIPGLNTPPHLAVVIAVITATAGPLFQAPLPLKWAAYVLVILVGIAACTGLGLLIGVISSSARENMLWSQLIFLPSMLLGGLMLPYDLLPEAAQVASRLLPSTHIMNALNSLAYERAPVFDPLASLLVLAAGALMAFGLAILLFSWDRHNQTRRGHPVLALLALLPYALAVALLG